MQRSELPAVGQPLAGGIYMGDLARFEGGPLYAVIKAPKAEGEFFGTAWPAPAFIEDAMFWRDGAANTAALASAGSDLAQQVQALRAGGFEDWHIPSAGAIALVHTNWGALPEGERLTYDRYGCSTQDNTTPDFAIVIPGSPDEGMTTQPKTIEVGVFAVRMVRIED